MSVKKVYIGEKAGDVQYNVTAKVGAIGALFTDGDRGKPVKLGADSTYVACAASDAMEAFIVSLENYTADQLTVGTVRTSGYKEAMIAAAGWTIGGYVVADAQAALGVYNDANQFPRPKVKISADVSAMNFKWRICSVIPGYTVGQANAVVVLERV
jgi:hypothetical protein